MSLKKQCDISDCINDDVEDVYYQGRYIGTYCSICRKSMLVLMQAEGNTKGIDLFCKENNFVQR